jgi:hypothetical protein
MKQGMKNSSHFCESIHGTLAGLKCPLVPNPWQCVEKDCGHCLHDTSCNFCTGTIDGKPFAVCKPKGVGEGFCSDLSGSLTLPGSCPAFVEYVKTGVAVLDKVNSGELNEAALNSEINKEITLGDKIVTVTVITKAESLGGSIAKFDIILDVTSDDAPPDSAKEIVCGALSKTVASNLALKREGVSCSIVHKSTSQKRQINSYAAGLTVDGSLMDGATQVYVSLALVLASVAFMAF